jgi:hypothetical protein
MARTRVNPEAPTGGSCPTLLSPQPTTVAVQSAAVAMLMCVIAAAQQTASSRNALRDVIVVFMAM